MTTFYLSGLIFLAARSRRLVADIFELTDRNHRVMPILITIPMRLFFPNVLRRWKIFEEVVMSGDDATVEHFKLSYLSDCNMTSVAVRSSSISFGSPKKQSNVIKFQI